MNGNVSVPVYDTSYDYPYPEYTITFQRPEELPILIEARLVNNPNLPHDIEAQTKAAIIAAFTGADGGSRARIGAEIVAGRFYGGLSAISPYVSILSVLLGTTTATDTRVTPGIDQYPIISEDNITITLI